MKPEHNVALRQRSLLGNGRSAAVYRMTTEHGDTARKIFTGSMAAGIAQLIFYGAPLDYRWNEAAVQSAYYRRKVLRLLLKCWFGDSLRIADAYGWGRDEDEEALYLDTEFSPGYLIPFFSPFLFQRNSEFDLLRKCLMPKLQEHLLEAGLVGTVWQAGYGQPCAFPNFLCIRNQEEGEGLTWVWIDAESGVPAIVSYNLRALLTFYIPQAIKRGRVLFDDLDPDQLGSYMQENKNLLRDALTPDEWGMLNKYADALIEAHARWSEETRLTRSVGYYFFRGTINDEQRDFYLDHKVRWYGFLVRYLSKRLPRKIRDLISLVKERCHPLEWFRMLARGLISPAYRLDLSRKVVMRGIDLWGSKNRISSEQKEELVTELHDSKKSMWLADFGVHLAIKPLGYLLRFTLIPALVHFNLISVGVAGVLFIFMGNLLRTSYTICRAVECLFKRQPIPWIALLLSSVPSIGVLAFPCQMFHSARKGHLISQMIIYESCSLSVIGLPIWGGRDNGWEHWANQFAHRLIWTLWG